MIHLHEEQLYNLHLLMSIIFIIFLLIIDFIAPTCYTFFIIKIYFKFVLVHQVKKAMNENNKNNSTMRTRDRVLLTLLRQEKCSISELASELGINPISVRHHLTKLQADGLVDSFEVRHGVGRPLRLYFLTENGQENFPKRYLSLTQRILDQLKETLPKPLVKELFTQIALDIALNYQDDLKNLPLEDRLPMVEKILRDEGFIIEWDKKENEYQIHVINCPYRQVGSAHPEICAMDETLISNILSVPVQRVECRLNGSKYCTYVVTEQNKEEVQNGYRK